MKIKSYAKINLTLEILNKIGKFHTIKSIIIPIALADIVEIRRTKGSEDILELDGEIKGVPADNTNLAAQSLNLMKKRYNLKNNYIIKIKKNIPSQAGLGGGSSNAAAVIYGLNEMEGLNLSQKELEDLGKNLGSDVPFFFGRISLVEGRGEIITRLPLSPSFRLTIIKPSFSISSFWAYKNFPAKLRGEKGWTEAMIVGLRENNLKKIKDALYNDLERVVIKEHPQILTIKNKLLTAGAVGALMSGSGSAVFGIMPEVSAGSSAINRTKFIKKLSSLLPKNYKIYFTHNTNSGLEV